MTIIRTDRWLWAQVVETKLGFVNPAARAADDDGDRSTVSVTLTVANEYGIEVNRNRIEVNSFVKLVNIREYWSL